MKRPGIIILFLLAGSCAPLFAMGVEEPPPPLPGTTEGPRIEISLEPGPYYSKDMNYVVFHYTVWPQVAVWIETTDGEYIDTLYVTRVTVDKSFKAAPDEGRPEALPVWSHISGNQNVDGVSSPTTVEDNVSYGSDIVSRLEKGTYVIMLETNRSYDWNDQYTKKNSGVNGQPSVIYRAELTIGEDEQTAEFIPVGTGSVDGSSGAVSPGLEGIDTAMKLFSSMKVSYKME